MHIDLGGAVLLFVVGGIVGLIVQAVYNRGYRKGRNQGDRYEHEHD